MKNIKVQITAYLLTFVMIFMCLPVTISANETIENVINNKVLSDLDYIIADSQEYIDDNTIGEINEVVSLREENVKHFRLADGTYEAITYPMAVHRKDRNGQWQDINNNLSIQTIGKTNQYTTVDARLKFADNYGLDLPLFVLSENGYSISMFFVDDENTKEEFTTVLSANNKSSIIDNEVFATTSVKNTDLTLKTFSNLDEAIKINNTSTIKYS